MLLQSPTVEQLSAALQENGLARYWSSVVTIQPHGSHPPFFCIHGVGGNIVGFRDLGRHMGPTHPFYGLQARGLDGQQSPLPRSRRWRPTICGRLPPFSREAHISSEAFRLAGWSHTRWRSSSRRRARKWVCWLCLIPIQAISTRWPVPCSSLYGRLANNCWS